MTTCHPAEPSERTRLACWLAGWLGIYHARIIILFCRVYSALACLKRASSSTKHSEHGQRERTITSVQLHPSSFLPAYPALSGLSDKSKHTEPGLQLQQHVNNLTGGQQQWPTRLETIKTAVAFAGPSFILYFLFLFFFWRHFWWMKRWRKNCLSLSHTLTLLFEFIFVQI